MSISVRPSIGVLVNHSVVSHLKKQKELFKGYLRYAELAEASNDADVIFFYFSIKNFDFKNNLIYGTYFDVDLNEWKQEKFPLPNLFCNYLINKGPSKFIEAYIEDILKKHGAVKVNSDLLFNNQEARASLNQIVMEGSSVIQQEESPLATVDMSEFNTSNRPVIGVFVDHAVIRRLIKQKSLFKSYPRLEALAKASFEADVTLYYFSTNNFDFMQNLVFGTSFNFQLNKWEQQYFPLPDVLYNRRAGGGPSRFIFEHIEQIFEERQVVKINSKSYFDKWEVYQDLSQVSKVRKYLPYSVVYEQERHLKKFLKKNDEAYLKGVRGGRGKWIFRVRKLPEGKFEYSYYVDDVLSIGQVEWAELIEEIQKFYGERKFIIQKAINLLKVEDSKVDFRAELQRDGEGKLNILGVCSRIGISQSPITIHSSAYPIEYFFKEFLQYSDEKINKLTGKIHKFLTKIYKALEKVYGVFGEIGIDFGIDQDGEIWFIEPNSKSAKVSLMKAYDDETFYHAFLNPVLFSKYLFYKKNRKTLDS